MSARLPTTFAMFGVRFTARDTEPSPDGEPACWVSDPIRPGPDACYPTRATDPDAHLTIEVARYRHLLPLMSHGVDSLPRLEDPAVYAAVYLHWSCARSMRYLHGVRRTRDPRESGAAMMIGALVGQCVLELAAALDPLYAVAEELRESQRPPLAWAVRAREDPLWLQALWEASTSPWAMVDLAKGLESVCGISLGMDVAPVDSAGGANVAATTCRGQYYPFDIDPRYNAAQVRKALPKLPPVAEIVAAHAAFKKRA